LNGPAENIRPAVFPPRACTPTAPHQKDLAIALGLVRPGNLTARKDAQPANPIFIDQHAPQPLQPEEVTITGVADR
ncbi:MAG: hypothetical protein K2Q09_03045, partial [Phycisphaerales bacterium]|nr:hypothetical protein [Phycisphaerales bacterium]